LGRSSRLSASRQNPRFCAAAKGADDQALVLASQRPEGIEKGKRRKVTCPCFAAKAGEKHFRIDQHLSLAAQGLAGHLQRLAKVLFRLAEPDAKLEAGSTHIKKRASSYILI